MEANLAKVVNITVSRTIENLEKNGMKAVYVPSSKEALALVKSMLVKGETIAVGGSVTLTQTGILDLVRNGDYNFIDRYDRNASREEIVKRLKQGLTADTFIMSSNAITTDGYLYNVDGSGNRVSALIFGPDRVIVVAGINKIVPKVEDAIKRVKNIAAPANAVRLDKDTYCVKNGHCMGPDCLAPGACPDTICRTQVITGNQSIKGRINVIIVGESLGY